MPEIDKSTHADLKKRVVAAAERLAPEIAALSRHIYEHPEVSNHEHMAHEMCTDILAAHGFHIDEVPGVETGFVATAAGGAPGPTIGLLAEYDALPEVGHACGHHLIAGSAIGAGLVLAELATSLPGTIKIFGCPAEEIGVGKAAMLARGVFSDTDAALTFHANDRSSVLIRSSAIHELHLSFRGKAAHAAAAPWEGASALDGVLLTYQNVNALRQFVRDGVRIHGIVTDGGDAFNVIPETAACRLAVRSSDPTELQRVVDRVLDCAHAAATASGTQVTAERGMLVESVRFNPPLADVVRQNLLAEEEPSDDWDFLASSDFGNVSNALPAVLFSIAAWPEGTALHTREAAEFAGKEKAFTAMLKAVRVMATSAVDLMQNPHLLSQVTQAHQSTPAVDTRPTPI